jgi:hypothetical protein
MSLPSVTYLLEAATEQLIFYEGHENNKWNKLTHTGWNLNKIKAICTPVPIWDML